MQALDLWKLSSEFSLIHAALIISGHRPDDAEQQQEHDLIRHKPGYLAAKTALVNAVRSGALTPITLIFEQSEYSDREGVDLYRTIVAVDELDRFVRSRGMVCDYFEREVPRPDFVAPGGSNFSKKLYAANRAWFAVTQEPARLVGKSPKQALEKWLLENAEELGLLNREGLPNQTGIEEICKVANWKPEGGATATPSNVPPVPQVAEVRPLIRLPGPQSRERPRLEFDELLDDEIPF